MTKINDRFYLLPLPQLLKIILSNLKHGHVLGLPKELFFIPQENDFFKTEFFGQKIASPIGVAAGPHTQMAQNIIIAWLAGARFIELKTIQTLDELDIPKPCIDMQDEGYNCEWSQEMKIQQAFDQYLDAWIIIHILQKELGFKSLDTIFNMSVGYDYKGIMQDNVQWFLDKMTDASQELEQKKQAIRGIYPQIDEIDIPARLSDNITLSTMHGCPPDEVEQIARYLITQRKLNTYIKLNPTLLGKDELHKILKTTKFKTRVPDIAFEHDLKFDQAVEIIKRLRKEAEQNNVFFGIKLTNTLESENHKSYFNADEMYMSGRALHPISINLARKFQNYFDGQLDISFSGGVDAFNITDVLKTGLRPITVCSDLLKPGGYGRLAQYYENLRNTQQQLNIQSIDQLINHGKASKDTRQNALENLNLYADQVLQSDRYKRTKLHEPSIKTSKKLEKYDCIFAPCEYTCPTNQHVPLYMYHTARGDLDKAFAVVLEDNPFPTVLGYSCDHVCQSKCTQMNYTESLLIREIKRFIAEHNLDRDVELNVRPVAKTGRVAIIGGGPGGLSAAFYLKLYGFSPEIFEASATLGGMVAQALPLFRQPQDKVERDIQRILNLGIPVHYNHKVSRKEIDRLLAEYDDVIVAIGAQINPVLKVDGFEAKGVLNALEFLKAARRGDKPQLGKTVAVIGGGNTAMDVARISKRLVGPSGKVYILYRRTIEYMPAKEEEILDTLAENIEVIELVEPIRYIVSGGRITGIELQRMKLVPSEEGKRPRPMPVEGQTMTLPVDTVIPAIGQEVEKDIVNYAKAKGLQVIGDAANGGESIVRAVADGKLAAYNIIRKFNPGFHPWRQPKEKQVSYKELKLKRYRRVHPEKPEELPTDRRWDFSVIVGSLSPQQAQKEADRCLLCDELCDICTTVCPNMANQHYNVKPAIYNVQKLIIDSGKVLDTEEAQPVVINQKYQTLNIADWCNECGNCATFCPTAGKPYVDKPKVHLTWQSYMESPFGYYVRENEIYLKKENAEYKLTIVEQGYLFEAQGNKIRLDKNFRVEKAEKINPEFTGEIYLGNAVDMKIISDAVKQILSGSSMPEA